MMTPRTTTERKGLLARATAVVVALVAAIVLGGCDLEFPEQDVVLYHDQAADRLDIFLVYHGVTAPSDDAPAIDKAVAAARRILEGRREFMLLDWPLHWDLDEERTGEGPWTDAGWVRRAFRFGAAGAFTDAQGRLCGYQLFHLDGVSEGLRRLNAAISGAVAEGCRSQHDDAPTLSAAYLRALVDKAEAGTPWILLSHGRLVVDVPAPDEDALSAVVDAAKKPDGYFLANLLAQVRAVLPVEDRLLAQIGDYREGMTVLALRRPGVTYRPKLHQALLDRHVLR